MKYKVGDKVRIREDLIIDKGYENDIAFVEEMEIYKGKEVTIFSIYEGFYHILEDDGQWCWTDNMFKDETTIYFARKNKDVILPSKNEEDAGYDVYAYFKEDYIIINPHETKLIPTGLYSCCSSDYVLLGRERGSTGSIGMKCGAGVIDSSYRGEIFIAITNENDIPISITKDVTKTNKTEDYIEYPFSKGICQLLLVPVPKANIQEISVEDLQNIPSKRGDGALGSSNK